MTADDLLTAFKRKAHREANAQPSPSGPMPAAQHQQQQQGPAAMRPPSAAGGAGEDVLASAASPSQVIQPPQSRLPPRPFSAGLMRHHITPTHTNTTGSSTSSGTGLSSGSSGHSVTASVGSTGGGDSSGEQVPGSPTFDKTGPFTVPSDGVIVSLTDEGLQLFIASMERKLRLARQETLVRTYGRPSSRQQ